MTNTTTPIKTEHLILRNLTKNEEFSRKVLPYIKPTHFTGTDKIVFGCIKYYISKYNKLPTSETLSIILNELKGLKEETVKEGLSLINSFNNPLSSEKEADVDWLTDTAKTYCQDREIYNAVTESIEILNDPKKAKKPKTAIPGLLEDALGFDFDIDIGHDYLEDFEARYNYMHKPMLRIPFDIEFLNELTKGGMPEKTMLVYMAGVNVGKSLIMCSNAAAFLADGRSILYITAEMSEQMIAQRIDANLLNIPLDDLEILTKEDYVTRCEKLRLKTHGKLVIKEYSPKTVNSNIIKSLLKELWLKKGFKPDVIFIDYINICASSVVSAGHKITNSYGYMGSVTEEMRGIAVECNTRVISATQVNREGFKSSDPGMENTSESWAVPAGLDYMIVVTQNEEMEKLGQYLFKQDKNRYGKKAGNRKRVVGVDYTKMRIYNLDASAQLGIVGTVTGKANNNSYTPFSSNSNNSKANSNKFRSLKT